MQPYRCRSHGLQGHPSCVLVYTVYKALTAIRLARDLTAQGIPAVPIFWLASEDHDFPEVSYAYSFDASRQPVRFAIEPPPHSAGHPRPVGPLPIADAPVAELRRSLASFPHGAEISAIVEAAYPPGYLTRFRSLLRKLLPGLGLLTLDPLDPAIRSIAAPFLAGALRAAPDLKTRLLERSAELVSAGYHAQVHLEPKTSLFFLLENGERTTLRCKDSEFASFCDRAAEISPNALLRPVMQDYLLPTAAFIGGPGEIAYLAQSQVVYSRLLSRMPVILARGSFTLLEARTAKMLTRYKLALPDALVPENALQERVASALVPAHLEDAFVDTAGELDNRLSRLTGDLERFDPARLSRRSPRAAPRSPISSKRCAARPPAKSFAATLAPPPTPNTCWVSFFPHRHLQERFYSILPFLAAEGPGLVHILLDNVSLDCPDHRVLTL